MEVISKEKCRSLRFEDREKCLSDARDDSWYCEHHGQIAVCLKVYQDLEDLLNRKHIKVESEEQYDAKLEVLSYMQHFQMSIMNGVRDSGRYWWMAKMEKIKRRKDFCKSIELQTGQLCTSPVETGRFCRYHQFQHDILCQAYHLDDINVQPYGVDDSTKKFVEFVLRKEFDTIFIGEADIGHKKRYGYLVGTMFDYPYQPENFEAIDPEYYRNARGMAACIDRELRRHPVWHFDEDDRELDEQFENYVPQVKEVVPYIEEDWDD